MISDKHKKLILRKLEPFNPTMVGVFGSYARNTNHSASDLDILVDFDKTVNLLDLIGLELDLSELLGIKVDLVTKKSLHPTLESSITKDLQRIL
jgi:predicted nucleotidyltransferase